MIGIVAHHPMSQVALTIAKKLLNEAGGKVTFYKERDLAEYNYIIDTLVGNKTNTSNIHFCVDEVVDIEHGKFKGGQQLICHEFRLAINTTHDTQVSGNYTMHIGTTSRI